MGFVLMMMMMMIMMMMISVVTYYFSTNLQSYRTSLLQIKPSYTIQRIFAFWAHVNS